MHLKPKRSRPWRRALISLQSGGPIRLDSASSAKAQLLSLVADLDEQQAASLLSELEGLLTADDGKEVNQHNDHAQQPNPRDLRRKLIEGK